MNYISTLEMDAKRAEVERDGTLYETVRDINFIAFAGDPRLPKIKEVRSGTSVWAVPAKNDYGDVLYTVMIANPEAESDRYMVCVGAQAAWLEPMAPLKALANTSEV